MGNFALYVVPLQGAWFVHPIGIGLLGDEGDVCAATEPEGGDDLPGWGAEGDWLAVIVHLFNLQPGCPTFANGRHEIERICVDVQRRSAVSGAGFHLAILLVKGSGGLADAQATAEKGAAVIPRTAPDELPVQGGAIIAQAGQVFEFERVGGEPVPGFVFVHQIFN